MQSQQRGLGKRKLAVCLGVGLTLSAVGCELEEFTATSSITLDTREVVRSIVKASILTPLEAWIDDAVDHVFDQIESDD